LGLALQTHLLALGLASNGDEDITGADLTQLFAGQVIERNNKYFHKQNIV